ncbi:unnamed protein product, partial [Symbiodinium sp. KB8]
DIHFHKSLLSWLYDLIADLLKGSIGRSINSAVESAIENAINTSLNEVLSKLPTSATIGGGKSRSDVNVGFTDVSVQSSPSTFLTLGDAFAVANDATHKPCPVAVPVLPQYDPSAATRMLQLFIASAPIECLAYTAFQNDAFNYDVNPTTTPKFVLPLNTD